MPKPFKKSLFNDGPTRETIDIAYKTILNERIVWLVGEIDDTSVFQVITEVQALTIQDDTSTIQLFINSSGGSVYAGCALIDMIKSRHMAPIETICYGHAMSMAAYILASAPKGSRFIAPHSTIMIHQASAMECGKTEDMEVSVEEMKRIEGLLYRTLAKDTGTRMSKIKKDCKVDYFMSADEAIKYGICDKILR